MGTNRNRTRFGYGNRDFGRNNYQREELIENLKDRIDKLSGVFKAEDEDIELEGFHQLIDEVEEEEDEVNPRVSRYRDGVAQNRVQAHMYPRPKVKRSVSFAENGNVIKYFEHGSENDASVSSEDNEQVVHNEVQGMKDGTFE